MDAEQRRENRGDPDQAAAYGAGNVAREALVPPAPEPQRNHGSSGESAAS